MHHGLRSRLRTIVDVTSASVLALFLCAAVAPAGDPTGIWAVGGGHAKVKIAACAQALCATIASIRKNNDPQTGQPWTDKNNLDARLRERPLLGLTLAFDMRPDSSADRWVGQVYGIDHGRAFDGSITLLSANRLKIEGCVLLICESDIWTRAE